MEHNPNTFWTCDTCGNVFDNDLTIKVTVQVEHHGDYHFCNIACLNSYVVEDEDMREDDA